MSYQFNFCRECGAAAADEWTGYYNQETGEKIMQSVCSKNPCHTEHVWQTQPLFARGDRKCSRCGKLGWWDIDIF